MDLNEVIEIIYPNNNNNNNNNKIKKKNIKVKSGGTDARTEKA